MNVVDDLLVVNTYGGSLLVAAKRVLKDHPGLSIRGSYEDVGYGSKTQALNFPDVPLLTKRAEWPAQDLSRTIVIAHPPCSGFSHQNKNNHVQERRDAPIMGTDSPAFHCTVDVCTYAMENRAAAVLIESVQPALEGAREVHDGLAQEHGYAIYRILQNACDFGVAQNRKRFWVLFVRTDLDHGVEFFLKRRFATVVETLSKTPHDEPIVSDQRRFDRILNTGLGKGYPRRTINTILRGDKGSGQVVNILKKELNLEEEKGHIVKEWTGRHYYTSVLRLLPPDGLATVLLCDNIWAFNGKPLTPSQYCLLMGFPARYKFHSLSQHRFLLSKGVCPPVAEWMLRTTIDNLERTVEHKTINLRCTTMVSVTAKSGDVVDLQATAAAAKG